MYYGSGAGDYDDETNPKRGFPSGTSAAASDSPRLSAGPLGQSIHYIPQYNIYEPPPGRHINPNLRQAGASQAKSDDSTSQTSEYSGLREVLTKNLLGKKKKKSKKDEVTPIIHIGKVVINQAPSKRLGLYGIYGEPVYSPYPRDATTKPPDPCVDPYTHARDYDSVPGYLGYGRSTDPTRAPVEQGSMSISHDRPMEEQPETTAFLENVTPDGATGEETMYKTKEPEQTENSESGGLMTLLRRCSRNKVPKGRYSCRPDTPSSDYENSCLKDRLRHNCMTVNPIHYTKKWEMNFGPKHFTEEFLSPSDIDVYRNLYNFHNSAKELLLMSLPAVVSLVLCPITLLVHENMSGYFWPNRTQPAVNEAVACFLAPSGMVYAVSFGFAFQQVLDKLNGIKTKLNVELNELEELIILTKRLKSIPDHCKTKIFVSVKNEMICIIKYLAKMNGYQYIGLENDGDIWSVVNELREGKVQHQVDVAIINKIVNYLGSLNNICDKMKILHSKMHILQWGFLETVSYFSFFGVQMVKAESERLELTMCLLTTFSITMLCFIVADIDNPFHGFFRIDLTVIGDILMMLEEAYYLQVHIKSPVQQITKKETPGK